MLKTCYFIKKRLWYRCFPASFAKHLNSPILQEISKQLLLRIISWDSFWMQPFKINNKDTRTTATERCSNYFVVDFRKIVIIPTGIYLLKSIQNTRTEGEICSKLTIKTPEWRQWYCTDVIIVNFNHILHINLVFPLFFRTSKCRLRHGYFDAKFIVKTNIVWNVNMFFYDLYYFKFGFVSTRISNVKNV